MSIRKVPALKLSDYSSSDLSVKDKFKKDLYNSFKEYGFVVITDHSVSPELIKSAYEIQKKLFNLPESVKNQYLLNNGGQRAYSAFRSENAKDSKIKDLKEFWHVGRELNPSEPEYTQYLPNIWPSEIPEFKETFLEIYSELETMGNLLLEALESSFGVPDGFFKPRMVKGNSILRLLHYPPVPVGAEPNAIRAAAHSDINTLTLLVSSAEKGLELLDKNGQWLAVDGQENSIVVNMGDMLSRITNDDIPSTIHRVTNPDVSHNVSRYSMPFFHHFRSEVILDQLDKYKVDPPKYSVITADEFLHQRLKEIGLKK